MNKDGPIIEQVLDKLKIKIGQLHNLVASSCRDRNSYVS